MSALIPEVDAEAAARFGLMLEAARRGNTALVAEMLMSIPANDLAAIDERLALFNLDLRSLLKGPRP